MAGLPVNVMSHDSNHDPRGRRLESWKEVAAYLGRDVRTVQRWERQEKLPVHRLQHSKLGSLYAFAAELDAWRNARELGPSRAVPRRTLGLPLGTRWTWIAATFVTAALLAGARWMWPGRPPDPPASAVRIRSIAVLPLANFSGDQQQEYFADGMTEALITRLSSIPGLRVISRTSVMRFKNTAGPTPEIAKALNVDGIVEGSVTRSGARIRVTATLIRGETDTNLWSGGFDREVHDVLALQSDVAQAIAQQVEASLSREQRTRLAASRTVAPEVYETYLKARFLVNKRTRATGKEAVRLFETALAMDPTFAPAYAGLAEAYHNLGTIMIGGLSPAETLPKALVAAQKASELDPDLSDGHAQLAYIAQREWRWAEAEVGFRRAIRLNPNDSAAHLELGDLLVCLGRFDEAVAMGRRGRDMDPLSFDRGADFGMILIFARRHDDAIRELHGILALEPENSRALWYLGIGLIQLSRLDEAIDVLERSLSRERHPGPLGTLAIAYARAGRRADARRVLDELTRRAQTTYVPPAAFVTTHIGLGDVDAAFRWLERAYAERSNMMRGLKVNPNLDPLRGDPRFADLLRRVGLE
jgi:TolB-like protein/Flp pilus assembly protein TadD